MRFLRWGLLTLGILLLLPALLWFGYGWYMNWQLNQPLAGARIITTQDGKLQLGVYSGGDQLVGPPGALSLSETYTSTGTETAIPLASSVAGPLAPQATDGANHQAESIARGADVPILPPTRLLIERIGVDAKVVLGDNDNLPRFKGVGWFWGTGFPGFRGNMVFFGHLNGEFETFGRLDELTKGDLLVVEAMGEKYKFVVADSKVVPASDVSVLAPTLDYRATLITCTGTFFPATRDYSHRLIVTAFLDGKPAGQ